MIGGASVITIVLGLVRTKAAALLLGPAGVGTIGLLQNLLQLAAMIAMVGIGTSGTRLVAEAASGDDPDAPAVARRALFWAATLSALVGTAATAGLRGTLARHVLDDPAAADTIGLMSLGVGASVVAAAQTALLTGLRRVRRIAALNVLAGLLGSVAAVAALALWGGRGIVPFVLANPVALMLCGFLYVRSERAPSRGPADRSAVMRGWGELLRGGLAIMLANSIAHGGNLLVRAVVQHRLGAAPLGEFQAAWYISVTYLAVVLQAMGTDYLPRLTASLRDEDAADRVVNDQMEVALLLASPVIVAMIGFGPVAVRLLYSSEFAEAAAILRWQLVGDVFKIASWPISYVLLATGAGRLFIATETAATALLVLLVALLTPAMGVQGTGLAVTICYMAYLPMVWVAARGRVRITLGRAAARSFAALLGAAAATFLAAAWSTVAGLAAAAVLTPWFAWRALVSLGELAPASVRRLAGRLVRRAG